LYTQLSPISRPTPRQENAALFCQITWMCPAGWQAGPARGVRTGVRLSWIKKDARLCECGFRCGLKLGVGEKKKNASYYFQKADRREELLYTYTLKQSALKS
jgi:hypothetical protein